MDGLTIRLSAATIGLGFLLIIGTSHSTTQLQDYSPSLVDFALRVFYFGASADLGIWHYFGVSPIAFLFEAVFRYRTHSESSSDSF